ncbi:MAG TPA: sensor histidine kinase [Actinomycetota bacterium]|jgi:signal transduction histidine kinase
MRPGTRRLAWVIWGCSLVVLAVTLMLTIRNGSVTEDPLFIVIAVALMLGYGTVGALVASRVPRNPIGWLLMTTGVGFLVAAAASEYATYTYHVEPSALPLREVAAWLSNWLFLVAVTPVPLVLALFPTGTVQSPRWRWLPPAIVGVFATGIVATILRVGPLDFSDLGPDPPNPTGVDALTPVLEPLSWAIGIAGIGLAIASVVSLAIRYRASHGEERQQIRWLAYVGFAAIAMFVATVLTAIGLGSGESTALNDLLFFAFLLLFGIGIPASAGIAVLRYRLWDLDVVMKKTLVATVLVLFLTAASLVVLLLIGGIVVGPLADSPGATLAAGVIVGACAWPLLRLSRRIADRIVYGGRATPYEVLTEFSDRLADAYSSDDVLPRMASILGAGTGADRVTIWLLVDGELRPAATWPDTVVESQPAPAAALADLTSDAFVVRHQGEQLGAITVAMPANDPMNPAKEKLIHDLTGQAGLVLRNVRLIEELRESRRRIVAAVDEGRRRLERNIHDGAQQQLVALSVKLRLADQVVERDPDKARELLGQLQVEVNAALENLRDLARGIYPPLLADSGLAAALEAQARKTDLPILLEPDGIGRYTPEVEATVYFCVLEALQNVAKYAEASRVAIAIRQRDGMLEFEVRDDGVGFEPGVATAGTGLQGMADRLDAVGGTLQVTSAPGAGTTISGRVPARSIVPGP